MGPNYENGRLLELYRVQMGSTNDLLGSPIIVATVAISVALVTLLLKLNIRHMPRSDARIIRYLTNGHLLSRFVPNDILGDVVNAVTEFKIE